MALHDTPERLCAIRDESQDKPICFTFSSDASARQSEMDNLKQMEANGYIRIRLKAIGYYICELTDLA